MGQTHGSAFCPRCKDQVLTTADRPAHLIHFLIVLAGLLFYSPLVLWAFFWLLAAVVPRTQRCTKCGGDIALLRRAARAEEKARAKAAKRASAA